MGPFLTPAAPAAARWWPGVSALWPCEHHAAGDAPGRDGGGWCQGPGTCQGRQSLPRKQGNMNVPGDTCAMGPGYAPCVVGVMAEVGTSPWGPACALLLK